MLQRPFAARASALACAVILIATASAVVFAQGAGQSSGTSAAERSDLDAFMERVLAKREVNRKTLNDYILDEREVFEILGPSRTRLHRSAREYTWFVRDGIHVRSPLRIQGVTVGEDDRIAYEERWLRNEKNRQALKAKREEEARAARARGEDPDKAAARKEDGHIAITSSGISTSGMPAVPTEPRFVSEAYFMDFKFEAGNYLLAGREQLAGQDVLKIEYYPTQMFGGPDDEKTPREVRRQKRDDRERELEEDIERKMNRTSLVTLWVDPKEHQIVKYTFDNVWLDFLPAAWLVRVDKIRASMTMTQPFPGVWLPEGINIEAGITLANGSFEALYVRSFREYRQADVKSRITVPKRRQPPQLGTATFTAPADLGTATFTDPAHSVGPGAPALSGDSDEGYEDPVPPGAQRQYADTATDRRELVAVPFADSRELVAVPFGKGLSGDEAPAAERRQPPPQQPEIIRELRVHGNAVVGEADVLKIAGLAIGATVDPTLLETAEQRLRATGHFETVQIRKRYRSLADPTDVAIVLVVHEKTGVRTTAAGEIRRPVMDRITNRIMFLPILGFADGYGFTYGARFSTVDLLGAGERLSVPLTWGGTRRIALEAERTFSSGPFTRLFGSAALWQRENPGFVLDPEEDDDSTSDRRVELRARAERSFAQMLFTGFEATRATVDFGPLPTAHQWTIGADAALDTRGDPAFPANAIYLGAGWNALRIRDGGDAINRYTLDGRGYLRLVGQPVIAARVQYFRSDAPLPPWERWLVGGASSLRGFRTGTFNGDKALVTSAELRVPFTSVVSGGKLGFTAFFDASKVGDDEVRIQDARWHRSAGGGLFLIASIIRINVDLGRELRKGGGTRLHLSSGFAF